MSAHADIPAGDPGRVAYSVEEAADLIGIGRTVMFQLVMAGEVDSFKVGRRRLIPRDAIHSFVARLRAQETAQRQAESPPPHQQAPRRP